jgi:hypothetical protein
MSILLFVPESTRPSPFSVSVQILFCLLSQHMTVLVRRRNGWQRPWDARFHLLLWTFVLSLLLFYTVTSTSLTALYNTALELSFQVIVAILAFTAWAAGAAAATIDSSLPPPSPSLDLKQCLYCSTAVPASSLHCRFCNKCTPRLDHHCFFLNTCIGTRNYRYFASTIAAALPLFILLAFASAVACRNRHDLHGALI